MTKPEYLIGTRWRHKKRGITYRIIADRASLQCSTSEEFEKRYENEHWIVYQAEMSGNVWIRPRTEFLDGRFEWLRESEAA